MTPRVLAVDLGLRTGLALFEEQGFLAWFRSHHFANVGALKRGVYGIVKEARPTLVVVEGDSRLAAIWQKAVAKLGASLLHPSPEQWRKDVLLPREQKSAVKAKTAARELARKIIAKQGAPRGTELRTDTAEAICLGYWAVLQLKSANTGNQSSIAIRVDPPIRK